MTRFQWTPAFARLLGLPVVNDAGELAGAVVTEGEAGERARRLCAGEEGRGG